MTKEVRVRIAPSPTGFLHLGTARTALYNWLFARHTGGKFILRVEDTDRERSTTEAVDVILDGLKWLGLDWDEGPVFQSENTERYTEQIELLKSKGLVRLDDLGKPELGEALVFDVPSEDITYTDLVKGDITKAAADLDPHLVLARADGSVTYNFACVVDDAAMGITHVIRGDDHVANTWKQILLYKALGLEVPEFAHLPMIHSSSGKKLSKRDGAVAVTDYKDKGYLREALFNFLALLGWSPGDDTEIMSREELVERFELKRVKTAPAQFDFTKFEWLNGQYIQALPLDELKALLLPIAKANGLEPKSDEWFTKLVEVERGRLRTLNEFPESVGYFFADEVEVAPKAQKKVLNKAGAKEALTAAREALANIEPFLPTKIEDAVRELSEKLEIGMGKIAQPIRVAVTGSTASPPIGETCELIGKDTCLERIDKVLAGMESA